MNVLNSPKKPNKPNKTDNIILDDAASAAIRLFVDCDLFLKNKRKIVYMIHLLSILFLWRSYNFFLFPITL